MATSTGVRPPQLSARTRAGIVKRLSGISAQMVTATIAEMEQRHDWYNALDPENRSWIGVVARAGIDGFVEWFAGPDQTTAGIDVFGSAPRALARHISLHQTVELVRTTIDVVESSLQKLMPRSDRPVLQAAILNYSREVAFAAAEVYARAAESRGAWDARLEALVVDAVVRGEADATVLSRASTLGWRGANAVSVVVGGAPAADNPMLGEELRRRGQRLGVDLLSAIQGDQLVVVLGGDQLVDIAATTEVVTGLSEKFADGAIIVGPLVDHLAAAASSARAALSGIRAAAAWPEAPRPVAAEDLLPERALSGDGHARRALAREVYEPLRGAGGGLLETLVGFLDCGGSIEGTARQLFVHANTVRYRLKRIAEVTGFDAGHPRDAYVLRMALTLGRLYSPDVEG